MSSVPTPEGVSKLCRLAMDYRSFDLEIEMLEERKVETDAHLARARERYSETKHAIVEQLRSMDCASTHNNGWESRFTWMLAQMTAVLSPPPLNASGTSEG